MKAMHSKHLSTQSLKERKEAVLKKIQEKRKGESIEDQEWEDVDEHEREVYATTGYFDVPDDEAIISKEDQKLLKKMEKRQEPSADEVGDGAVTLADMIMKKYNGGDDESNLKPD